MVDDFSKVRPVVQRRTQAPQEQAMVASQLEPDQVVEEVKRKLARMMDRPVVGLRRLSHRVLFSEPGLFIDGRLTADSQVPGAAPLTVSALSQRVSANNEKFLIVAPPGSGKSLALLGVFRSIIEQYDGREGIPVIVDLKREPLMAANPPSLSELAESEYPGCAHLDALVMVDALDEGLIGYDLTEIDRLLADPLFADAPLATCRRQFFDQYLSNSTFMRDRQIVELADWESEEVESYVATAIRMLEPVNHESLAEYLLNAMAPDGPFRVLVSIPLRLNMAISLLVSDIHRPDVARLTLLSLFEEFVAETVEAEITRKIGVPLTAAYEMLCDLAWKGLQGDVGHHHGRGELVGGLDLRVAEELVGKRLAGSTVRPDVVLTHLTNTALLERRFRGWRLGHAGVGFTHRSIQEFLIAAKAQDAFVSSSSSLLELFAIMLSPEIWEFLKEAIGQINDQAVNRARAAGVMIDAIELAEMAEDLPNRRIILEQLHYYLGAVQSPMARDYLTSKLPKVSDEWIARGIIVGRAFGGDSAPLDDYIDRMRAERADGGPTPVNDANVGCHLSMFGDQVFDADSPDVDRKGVTSERTVRRLVYQLQTNTNEPNWRIDLYTLLDLAVYRESSAQQTRALLTSLVEDLERIRRSFVEDRVARDWPETKDLDQLLAEIRG